MAVPVDSAKLNVLVERFMADIGASMHGPAVLLGEQLGLYKALAEAGPVDPDGLAKKTGIAERYLREWLAGQAASGYIDYDAKAGKYSMSPEQKFVLTDENGPVFFPGVFYIVGSMYKDQRRVAEAIQKGKGFGWGEHHNDLFVGTHKFFRPSYIGNLVSVWLPTLDGVVPKLQAGARVADVGCGLGSSTILMAKAFPKSHFYGYDLHLESIEWARNVAVTEQVVSNTDFEMTTAKTFPGKGFDLVAYFDCLHDMGDPVGALNHAREALLPDGTVMVVEPPAKETLEDHLKSPLARGLYNASLQICVPASLAQEGGRGLGAQASDSALTEVFHKGGFTRVKKTVDTVFNRVFELRP